MVKLKHAYFTNDEFSWDLLLTVSKMFLCYNRCSESSSLAFLPYSSLMLPQPAEKCKVYLKKSGQPLAILRLILAAEGLHFY